MTKVRGACYSIDASGTIGDYLTFRHGRRGPVAERKPDRTPADAPDPQAPQWPPSSKQRNSRHIIRCLGLAWGFMNSNEKASWLPLARKLRTTAYCAFVSHNARSFRSGCGMSYSYPASLSPTGMNVIAVASLVYGRSLYLTFDSTDVSNLFFLVIGHFSSTPINGEFKTMKALHFWHPDPKPNPGTWPPAPGIYTPCHTYAEHFGWDYLDIIESINYVPYAVGLKSGYLFSSCVQMA